jgi:hypothetical protein
MSSKEEIREAANYLATSKHYVADVRVLNEAIASWGRQHTTFVDERAPLNALIDLGLAYPEKLTKLYELIAERRRALPERKRADYQREYMRQSRARMTKALAIEELIEGRRITLDERAERAARIQTEFMRRREEFLRPYAVASWAERQERTREFWAAIDKELEHAWQEAQAVLAAPGHRKRRVVQVPPKPPANRQMFDALQNAKLGRK